VERRVTALAGVFVGGPARRMGGRAKGLLVGPDGATIVGRWQTLLEALGVPLVLVGGGDAYAGLGLQRVEDEPQGIGPLGGLVALLRRAGAQPALALACDMPFVSRGLLERLLAAPSGAPVVAPRREGKWEPLCARYDPVRVLPLALARVASPYRSLQRLLDDAPATELPLSAAEAGELCDWDSPDDVLRRS
jgi:molybdopterin-guanine dinucleotide biosynthesis protein A